MKEGERTLAVAITTIDNPYDPIDQFDEWMQYDMDMDYGTCALLDRVARTSDSLSDQENEQELERAIDEIILYDPSNKYKKIKRELKEKSLT